MKTYHKLKVPNDSAWDRKLWYKHVHYKVRYFCYSIHNIIRWIPTLWKDRDWDDAFILLILQKKIEFQRKHLVNSNRHMGIERNNRDMTIVLNLLERKLEEFYSLEKYDYHQFEWNFTPCVNQPEYTTMDSTIVWEKFDDYLAKYPNVVRKIKLEHPDVVDKDQLSLYVGLANERRANKLLWKILEERSHEWWD